MSQKKLKDFDERLHHDGITEKLFTFFHRVAEGLTLVLVFSKSANYFQRYIFFCKKTLFKKRQKMIKNRVSNCL